MLVILALRRKQQKDHWEFEASLVSIVSSKLHGKILSQTIKNKQTKTKHGAEGGGSVRKRTC